jgi:hypothetical protein
MASENQLQNVTVEVGVGFGSGVLGAPAVDIGGIVIITSQCSSSR